MKKKNNQKNNKNNEKVGKCKIGFEFYLSKIWFIRI